MENLNKKILIADDDRIFLMVLKERLLGEGFTVFTAQEGEGALAIARKEKLDAILLDILMPNLTGIDVAKKLREEKNDVIIIFLTALADIAHISEAIESNPSDYIIKAESSVQDIAEKIKKRLGIN